MRSVINKTAFKKSLRLHFGSTNPAHSAALCFAAGGITQLCTECLNGDENTYGFYLVTHKQHFTPSFILLNGRKRTELNNFRPFRTSDYVKFSPRNGSSQNSLSKKTVDEVERSFYL